LLEKVNKLDSRIYSVPGVNIVGAVIDTIEYLSQAAVIVVPVRKGTGMQIRYWKLVGWEKR
jgi:hypothetical protein